jgi:hypothetical protein
LIEGQVGSGAYLIGNFPPVNHGQHLFPGRLAELHQLGMVRGNPLRRGDKQNQGSPILNQHPAIVDRLKPLPQISIRRMGTGYHYIGLLSQLQGVDRPGNLHAGPMSGDDVPGDDRHHAPIPVQDDIDDKFQARFDCNLFHFLPDRVVDLA